MDVSFLKSLYDRPGPFASAYLDMGRAMEEAPKVIELRWRALRRDLDEQGAPGHTVEAIERLVERENRQRESGTLAVFASDGEIAHHEMLPGAPRAELSRFAPLPHVRPMLAQRGEPVPHVVAVVARTGGEITVSDTGGARRVIGVSPEEDHPVRKPKAGDSLRQARNQRAAEDTWRANAKKLAHAVTEAAGECGAEVVVVAGDVRMAATVLEELPEPVLSRTVEAGPAGPALDDEVARAVELKRTERVLAEVDRFHQQLTRRRAVEGIGAVAWALRQAKVSRLLLADTAQGAQLWTGPEPTDLAASTAELFATGVAWPFEDLADAALIRALVATDGELLLVPPDGFRADQGVGALLRFPD
jgi:Bacterial archaeo-eukaryotic release factor family 2